MSTSAIGKLIEEYENLRTESEEKKAELDALNKRRDAAEAAVITAILDAQEQTGVEGLRVGWDGRNYSVTVKNYYTIPKPNRDAAYEAMRNLGMGDLITEKVDDRSLTKELEEVFEENGCMYPEEYIPLFQLMNNYVKTALRRVKA